jgi:hypothetical protein
MKTVLLICYYFPPLGLGGINRPLNLFRRLPQHGYDCHLLTVRPVAYRAYEPELLASLDRRKIFRSGSRDPQRLLYLLGVRELRDRTIEKGQAVSDRFFPDNKAGWVKPAVRRGMRLLSTTKYDAIISTSPPISAHLVAEELSRNSGIPWVADFRDFWGSFKLEESVEDREFVARGKRLLKHITETAAAVTVVNDSIRKYLNIGELIANAYDEDLAATWKPPEQSDRFTIGLLGNHPIGDLLNPL